MSLSVVTTSTDKVREDMLVFLDRLREDVAAGTISGLAVGATGTDATFRTYFNGNDKLGLLGSVTAMQTALAMGYME